MQIDLEGALAALTAAWTAARGGDGAIVHLTGPAGAGKSTAAHGFLTRVRRPLDDQVVLHARCGQRADLPGRRRDLLEALIGQIAEGIRSVDGSAEEPQWILPSQAFLDAALSVDDLLGSAPEGTKRVQIFVDLLLAAARQQAVLLVLDDAEAAQARTQALVSAIHAALTAGVPDCKLLVVLISADPIADPHATAPTWTPPAHTRLALAGEPMVMPALDADRHADLCILARAGNASARLLGAVWGVPREAARARLDALVETGLVVKHVLRYRFASAGVRAHFARLAADLDAPIATALLAAAEAHLARIVRPLLLDVTQTWRDGQRFEGRLSAALDALWRAVGHFAAADRGLDAADAAVRFVEAAMRYGALAPMVGSPLVRLADRARRRQLRAALAEAAFELDAVAGDPRCLTIGLRLHVVRARYQVAIGDFRAAQAELTSALSLARAQPDPTLRVDVLRAEAEVAYASGRLIKGRAALHRLAQATDALPPAAAGEHLAWAAELIGRWEWAGLHDQLFPALIKRIEARGETRFAVQARIEQLVAAVSLMDADRNAELLEESLAYIRESAHRAEGADLLARCAADIVRDAVDRHYDTLSGEFFPPDLDGQDPQIVSLRSQLLLPIELFDHATELVSDAGDATGHVRVLTRVVHGIIDARERLLDLREHWGPQGGPAPLRLAEIDELLERGFFNQGTLQSLVDQVLALAVPLALHQLIADTAYEALERGLPDAAQQPERYVQMARDAYQTLDDVYGLCTLALLSVRHAERSGVDPSPHLDEVVSLLEKRGDAMLPEQRAFIHLRLGERLLIGGDLTAQATGHLERAVADYDLVGEVDQVQLIGAMLREVYRKQGDLGRYRALRSRFAALDARTPGVDPLGLEMRIEHLLNQARRQPDEQRAIAMIERCVVLFARMGDSAPRIDECFVEISKICRRRAERAQTEAGFADWIRRSLDAVRTAAGINKSLGNLLRLFEEYHELFDDLLAIDAIDEYRRARAEIRELAFSVGNLNELGFLFEEQLQSAPGSEPDSTKLAETVAVYTALRHHMAGLGATRFVGRIDKRFGDYLRSIGEDAMADALA